LWGQALRVCGEHAAAAKVAASIDRLFWRESDGFFADCLHGPDKIADDHLRPNQWLAIALGAVPDKAKARRALRASQCLLVPGAARSLAPRPVRYPLSNGADADPHHPYRPRYTGPEDTARKPAYHNGTAWCWQFPFYAEALVKVFGQEMIPAARRLLSSAAYLQKSACLGQLPEILDGDSPHPPRGCGAQAWSISEWVRVWSRLGSIF
jgi:starch synthase (maltosyl-transferring)